MKPLTAIRRDVRATLRDKSFAGEFILIAVLTSTFSVTVRKGAVYQTDGMGIVPQFWLFQIPLILALVFLRPKRSDISWPLWCFGGFVALSFASTVWAINPGDALDQSILLTQAWVALAVVMIGIERGVVTRLHVAYALAVAVGIHALTGFSQLVTANLIGIEQSADMIAGIRVGRWVVGHVGGAYPLAALIVLVAPLVLVSIPRQHVVSNSAIGLPIVVRAAATDAGRGAYVVAMAGLAVLLNTRLNRSRVLLIGIGVGIVLIPHHFVLVAPDIDFAPPPEPTATEPPPETQVGPPTPTPATPSPTPSPTPVVFDQSTLNSRMDQFSAGASLFVSSPVLGVGAYNFKSRAPEIGVQIHDLYLIVLVEYGLFGFILFFAPILIGLKKLFFESRDSMAAAGILAGLLGILAFSIFAHSVMTRPTVLLPFWIVIGIALSDEKMA